MNAAARKFPDDAAAAVCDAEWVRRFTSVWPLRLKEPATNAAVLQKLRAEYPEDPELAAWDRYLNVLRQADEWTEVIIHRPIKQA